MIAAVRANARIFIEPTGSVVLLSEPLPVIGAYIATVHHKREGKYCPGHPMPVEAERLQEFEQALKETGYIETSAPKEEIMN